MPTNLAEYLPRLKKLIPKLRGKRMGVLGDLMLDKYLWGTATRLSPEAAVEHKPVPASQGPPRRPIRSIMQ